MQQQLGLSRREYEMWLSVKSELPRNNPGFRAESTLYPGTRISLNRKGFVARKVFRHFFRVHPDEDNAPFYLILEILGQRRRTVKSLQAAFDESQSTPSGQQSLNPIVYRAVELIAGNLPGLVACLKYMGVIKLS